MFTTTSLQADSFGIHNWNEIESFYSFVVIKVGKGCGADVHFSHTSFDFLKGLKNRCPETNFTSSMISTDDNEMRS